MTLLEEIAEAQTYFNYPPENESNTCEWIILPLLWASGYAKREIVSRKADSARKIPDYTILSEISDVTWYLEAKAWKETLEEAHDIQALNYANQNGKRFVVLTNGQTWRLYDNGTQGRISDKRVLEASLRNTSQINDFLTALSKTEVLSGSLARLAAEIRERQREEAIEKQERQQRVDEEQRIQNRQKELRTQLHTLLPDQLKDPSNDLVLFISLYLNEKTDLEELTPETLSLWFEEILSQPQDAAAKETTHPATPPNILPSFSEQNGERTHTLKVLQGLSIDGKISKPIAIHTPDGSQITVNSWVGIAAEVVRWLLQYSDSLPLPFISSHRTRYFINQSAVHLRKGLRTKFKTISANGKTVYMDADRSGDMFLRDLFNLCQEMHISADEFRITYRD